MKRSENNAFCLEEMQMLPSEQLHQMLRAELDRSHKDKALILQISNILEQRDTAQSHPDDPALRDAYLQFLSMPSAEVHKSRQWQKRLAVAAALVCLVALVVPGVRGAPKLFALLDQWTQELFSFFGCHRTEENDAFGADSPELQRIYDMVSQQGVTTPVVPTWLPEGFALQDLKMLPTPFGNKIYARLENGEDFVTFSLNLYNNMESNTYAKNETNVEVYETGEIKHYLMENEGMWTAAWTVDNLECSLMTSLGKEALCQIIDSIYRR